MFHKNQKLTFFVICCAVRPITPVIAPVRYNFCAPLPPDLDGAAALGYNIGGAAVRRRKKTKVKRGVAMPEKNRSVAEMKRLADAAAGRIKCDVVIKNARYLDVFNAELRTGDIAVCGGKIVGIGSYNGMEEYDFCGKVVVPGLIDSHMHIESTQLCPEEFAALAVPRGTTVVIADPHEIVNVCGLAGADYIRRAAARTPLEVKLMLPSCVPATPFETSGAVIDADATARALKGGKFFGLGEMMNYPAVAAGDEEVLRKIAAAGAAGKLTDGHAPAMSGRELNS